MQMGTSRRPFAPTLLALAQKIGGNIDLLVTDVEMPGMDGRALGKAIREAYSAVPRIVLADDPVAADFVCTRLMGLNPLPVKYLAQAAEFLGNGTPERIVHLGERLPSTVQPFAVLPEFAHLRL